MALRADGRRDESLALLTKAEQRTPTDPAVLRTLADLTLAMGRKDRAVGYFTRLVELLPDAADIDELRNTLRTLKPTGGAS
jgi:Flp pilus assembly protein TadD